MGSPVKKIPVAKQRSDVYRGQSHWGQFMWIDEIGRAAKDHIRRFTCPEVRSVFGSEQSWRIKVIAFRIAVTVISVRHGTLKLTKKNAVSRCSDTQDRKLSRLARVDMNMITQLYFDYVRNVQTLLQSTVQS